MSNIQNAPEILTTREAAGLLGITPQTLKRYIKAGKVSVIRLPDKDGKTIRILKTEVIRLLGNKNE